MADEKKHFEVVVRGQYHAMNAMSGTPTLQNYEETFVLPSQEAALSNICKHLLSPRLKKSHADFIRYRTHELISITLRGYKPNPEVLQMDLDEMSLVELSDFCILRQIMIDPFKHGSKDIFAIREMVRKAYVAKRQTAKDNRESKNAVAENEAETLRKMNDLTSGPNEPKIQINSNEYKVSQNAKAVAEAKVGGGSTSAYVEPADEPLPPPEQDDPNGAEPVLE